MKNYRTLLQVAAAAMLTCTAGLAAAADTQTVGVTATVLGVCKFSGAAATIAFGILDQNDPTVKAAPVTVPYKCTKNLAAPSITTGTIVPLTSGGNTMAFTLDTFVTATGAGFSAPVDATSTARIAAAAFQDAPAGSYVGSVVLNINN